MKKMSSRKITSVIDAMLNIDKDLCCLFNAIMVMWLLFWFNWLVEQIHELHSVALETVHDLVDT